MTRDHAAPTTFSFLLLSLAFSFVDASPLKDFPHRRAVSSGFQRSRAWFDVGSSANDTLARTNGRIANGQYAAKGQFPYAARMMIGTGNSIYTCGGVLIGSRVVLTAAHCVTDNDGVLLDPGLIQLKIGVVDTSKSSPIYRVRSTITPMYNPYTMWGDVALLELSRPAKSPAARATLAPASRSVKSGSLITVMGWGETEFSAGAVDDLMYTTLKTVSSATCVSLHRRTKMSRLPNDHFCTAPASSRVMSCPGDSGGPYMYRPSPTSRPEVIGVVSYGPELACGEPGNFDVATSVVYWRKWINNMFVKYNLTR